MKRLLAFLFLSSLAFATTPVTGNLKTLGTGSSSGFVRFWLRGCAGNQPTVTGTGAIAPTSGAVFYVDLPANSSGVVSGTIYSTRDAAGTGGGDISCGGSSTAVWYGMQIWQGGKAGPETPIHAKSGVTIDISSVTPITSNPVVTSPTGDTTYCRIDGGNCGFTGPVTSTSSLTVPTATITTDNVTNLETSQYPVVDIRAYGASTGSSNNLTAFQAAFAEAVAIGGVVYVPPGVWLTGPLTGSSNLKIDCAGKYIGTIKLAAGSNADLLTFGAASKWQLSNCTLDGNASNQTLTSHVLRINNTSGSDAKYSVQHVFITNGHDDGIHIDSGTAGGSEFVDVYSYFNNGIGVSAGGYDNKWIGLDIGQSGLQGLFIAASSQHFTDVKSWFSGRVTGSSGQGIEQNSGISEIQCVNCEAQDNQAHGFLLRGSNNNYIGIKAQSNSQSGSGLFDGVALTSFSASNIIGEANAVADLNTWQAFALSLGGSATVANNYIRMTANGNISGLVTGTSGPTGNDVQVINSDGTFYKQTAIKQTIDAAGPQLTLQDSASTNSALHKFTTADLGAGTLRNSFDCSMTGLSSCEWAFGRSTTGGVIHGYNNTSTAEYTFDNATGNITGLGLGSFSGGIKAGASGFTIADSRSIAAITASLTTTAATSDNVTVTGATASSHCSLTATNSSAATNIATTFISAKTTNQITVSHTATASMTYDIFCSVN